MSLVTKGCRLAEGERERSQISGRRGQIDRFAGTHAGAEDPFQVEAEAEQWRPTPMAVLDRPRYAASLQTEVTCSTFRRGAAVRACGRCGLWPVCVPSSCSVLPSANGCATWTGREFRVTDEARQVAMSTHHCSQFQCPGSSVLTPHGTAGDLPAVDLHCPQNQSLDPPTQGRYCTPDDLWRPAGRAGRHDPSYACPCLHSRFYYSSLSFFRFIYNYP